MGQIIITSFVSLDGVMEAPEKWSLPYWNDEIAEFKESELHASDAQLLGTRTYEGFADAWPSRSGDYADRFNSQPKYVVSDSLETAEWNNSKIMRRNAYLPEEIQRLKSRHDGDILVHGSGTLAQWLLANRRADELRILLYPVVLGAGKRLLDKVGELALDLVQSRSMGSGVNLLTYRPQLA
ncbi:MAG: dihydrofolate reductase family protein [Sphingomicrobium sp.]